MAGLMRALRGVATGYMTGTLDIAAEKAKKDREDEVRKAKMNLIYINKMII